MENTIYIGLSRQTTLRTNLDIIANNVANVNTPGFRAQNLIFEEYVQNPRNTDDPLSFALDRGQFQVSESGPVSTTSNPLDVALVGPGFMGIVGPGGEVNYSRAGNFAVNAQGQLVTASGFPVADANGAPLIVPANSTEIKIDNAGIVSNQDGALGQIQVVEFDDIQLLEARGNNLYASPVPGFPAENTVVKQGHLEGSNVKPVLEMTRMIETLRDFQTTHRMITGEGERLRNAIRTLTSTN